MLGPLNVNYDNWMDTDIYYKGSWMLHSIRNTINDDTVWFNLLKSVFQHFKYKTVTSEEIINYMDSGTDYNVKPIFQYYLNNPDPPELLIKIKEKKENVYLKYAWRKVRKDFDMPVDMLYGNEVLRIYPTAKKQKLEVSVVVGEEIRFDTRLSYFIITGK
jgi:aminopeptidase N